MRPLGDLLGRRVLFDGWLETWRQVDERFIDACLTGVVLRDFDTAEALRGGIGHVWIRIDSERWENLVECHRVTDRRFSLKEPVKGAAEVVRYRRRNFTEDYGLQQLGFFGTDHLALLRSRFNTNGNRRIRFALTIAKYTADDLETLEAALRSMLEMIEAQEDDWRFTGFTLREATCNLKAQIGAIESEWRRRVKEKARQALTPVIRPARCSAAHAPLTLIKNQPKKKVSGFG